MEAWSQEQIQLLQTQNKDQEAPEKNMQAMGPLSYQVQPHQPLFLAACGQDHRQFLKDFTVHAELFCAHLGTALPNQPG